MGNLESNPVKNLDKRTARREYRDHFIAAIKTYRKEEKAKARSTGVVHDRRDIVWDGTQNVRVAVRKRPIFKHEVENHEFDVVTFGNGQSAVIHDARMHKDMKKMFMNHHEFQFDQVFDEKTDNNDVYASSVAPLTKFAAVDGGYCTCLVYGQTGSGKTFTMSSIYMQSAEDIFAQLNACMDRFDIPPIVSLSFVELAGDACHDLLNSFNKVELLSSHDGSVHAFPVVEPVASSAEELMALINYGCGCRATAATGVHDSSSRTHAILRIYIQRSSVTSSSDLRLGTGGSSTIEGVLTLVDLAGSEHRIDSMYHNADRRKEGANINASLMALKDCIRAKAAGKNASHQYRKSKLTMALKYSFLMPASRTLVIATVSPSSKDTEHSLNTVRHACIMDGQESSTAAANGDEQETRFVTGGQVVKVEVGEINVAEISRKNLALKKAGMAVDAKTSNGNVFLGEGPAHAAENAAAPEMTEKEKVRLRRASERRALTKLSPEQKAILMRARSLLGSDEKQAERLRRQPPATMATGLEEGQEGALDAVVTTFPRYGGIAVPRSPTNSSSSASRGKSAVDSSTTHAFHKLKASVYSAQGSVPEPLLRRQLKTLMKLNGYDAAEIDRLVPPSPTEKIMSKLQQPLEKSPRNRCSTMDDNDQRQSPHSLRGNSASAGLGQSQQASTSPRKAATAASSLSLSARRATMNATSTTAVSPEKGSINSPSSAAAAAAATSRPRSGSARPGNSSRRQQGGGDAATTAANREKKEAERVRGEAMAAAAVEEQALQRQSRHERAKAVRTKLEEDKKAAILARKPKSSPVRVANPTAFLDADTEVATDDQYDRNGATALDGAATITGTNGGLAEVDTYYVPTDFSNALARSNVHRLEIARLEAELQSLERDDCNAASSNINGAVIHGLRRQLQSHRAVLLREQRVAERKAVSQQQQQPTKPDAEEPAHRSNNGVTDPEQQHALPSTMLSSSSSAPAIIAMDGDSWSQQQAYHQTDAGNFMDNNNNNNNNNANCLRSQSAAGSTSTTTPTTNANVSDLDLYRRAVGFGGGMQQQQQQHQMHQPTHQENDTQDGYLDNLRSPPAAAMPMNQASSLARVKALAPRTKGRHRGASGSELYAGGLSATSAGSGGYEKRPAWNIDVPDTATTSEIDNNAAVEEKGRPYFDAATERENQYFLGLSDHFTDKAISQTQAQLPVRHHYGRRGQHQLVGASAAPFANDHSWQRSPEH